MHTSKINIDRKRYLRIRALLILLLLLVEEEEVGVFGGDLRGELRRDRERRDGDDDGVLGVIIVTALERMYYLL